MKTQFLYHPENDAYIASEIIEAIKFHQSHSLQGMRIGDINALGDDLFEAIKNCDVLILLIGTTFEKIAPIVWMNALQHQRPIVGIDIHTIPDEWGETRKKGGAFNTDGTFVGGKKAELFKIYDLPKEQDGISYIKNNIEMWCEKAIEHVRSNYGIT